MEKRALVRATSHDTVPGGNNWPHEGAAAMSDTGIVRRVDDLGRIVIPMELRRTLGIHVKDPISISVEGERIILEKYRESCVICGSEDDIRTFKDRPVCAGCIADIKRR
jgi:transcriptional pleiotropic regulator of transition state genes